MKKILLLLCIAFIGITSANAQAVWGIRAGACYSTANFSYNESYGGDDYSGTTSVSGSAGFEVGPVLYLGLKKNFYINTSAMFSMKNFDDTNVSYIEVPLYLGYSIPVGNFNLYAQAGPYAGIKVAGRMSPLLNTFNAGLGLVGGINLKKFKFELGYQQGLMNIWDSGVWADGYNAKLTIGSAFIGISYIF
ncbi:MAG: PorT family protein [Prevotellaceae bacterium]|nr:PorT family protein [Prevotellaceae bacterium]